MFYLDKGEFAETCAALCVSDGDLSVVFDPPSSTEDVVHTRGDLVPFVLISKPKAQDERLTNPYILSILNIVMRFVSGF